MKPKLFSFILLFCLLLVGCSVEGETATAVPTRVAVITNTAIPTPTQPPATDTPMVTGTAVLPTSTIAPTDTATPQPATQIPVSPPTGRIAFLWSPYPPVDGTDPSLTTNFYIASPGESIEEWQIETVVANFFGAPLMRISPDLSQAAILFAESEEFGFSEFRKINIYDFAADEFQNLIENQCCLYNFSWQPDSQAIIYSQVHDIFVAPLNGELPEKLTINNSPPTDGEKFNPVMSPDGVRLAFTTSNPHSLVLYNLHNGEYITLGEISYPSTPFTIAWSPDSQWLAFTNSFNQGLSLVNVESLAPIQLTDTSSRCFPVWATNGSRLAFTCYNAIYLWDEATQTPIELVKAELVGPPAWSPDNSKLATTFSDGDRTGFLITDLLEGTTHELLLNPPVRPAVWDAPLWSPDGNWLLVLSEPADQDTNSGIYIIDILNGVPYRVMDTTGLQRPYDFTWLPAD